MADYPDWTDWAQIVGTDVKVAVDIQGGYIMLPVDIQAQNITIAIDITAQTVGNIGIDIKAQTVGNIAVNIAASAVTLNMNLQSSAITLNVNLHSQTANISVNLAASAITLNVNVSSQTANINVNIAASAVTVTVSVTGTANIDIKAQSVAIFIGAEWGALQGNDQDLQCSATDQARDGSATAEYAVPGAKTFFVCGFAGAIWASGAADYDHHLVCQVRVMEKIGVVYHHRAMIGGNGGAGLALPKPIVIEGGNSAVIQVWNMSNITCDMRGSLWGYEV